MNENLRVAALAGIRHYSKGSGTTYAKKLFWISVLSFAMVSGATTTAQATYVASLADDFSALGSNFDSDTWSYRLSDWATVPHPLFNYLLPSASRDANQLWGFTFPMPPAMWSDTTGYWGIGKNDSGSNQVSGATEWANGDVWLHPSNNGYPLRFVISWLAPSAMTIDADWSFSMAPGMGGNGVAIEVDSLIGGNFTAGPFSPLTSVGPQTGSLNGVTVAAGDRLYWTIENWGDAGGDVTRAAITITQVPEPSSLLILGFGTAALLYCASRKRKGTGLE